MKGDKKVEKNMGRVTWVGEKKRGWWDRECDKKKKEVRRDLKR